MGLKGRETFVLHGDRFRHYFGDAALAVAGQAAVLRPVHPVLDVKMDGPLPGELPAFPGIKASMDIVGRVVHRAEVANVRLFQNGPHQVLDALRLISVDAVFVLVHQANAGFSASLILVPHTVQDVAPPMSRHLLGR